MDPTTMQVPQLAPAVQVEFVKAVSKSSLKYIWLGNQSKGVASMKNEKTRESVIGDPTLTYRSCVGALVKNPKPTGK